MAADREGVDRHLEPGDELLDEQRRGARRVERDTHGLGEVLDSPNEREPALTLTVGRLDHARKADSLGSGSRLLRAGTDLVRGLRHARLPRSRSRWRSFDVDERRRLRRDRVRQPQPFRNPCRDRRPASRCPARSARPRARRSRAARSPARPRSRRSRAGRRSESPERTDRGRARSRAAHAHAPRRAGRAGPAPHLGRGDACPGLALKDPPPPHLIFAVPRDGARETFLERRARAPAGQTLHLVRRADVAVDLARAARGRASSARRLPEQRRAPRRRCP